MSVDATRRVMDGYLTALFNGGDFGEFFTDEVSWTTMETGDRVVGREPVRQYITALHTTIFDAHPEVRATGTADGYAFIEADFVGTHIGEFAGVAPTGAQVRVSYSVGYDVTEAGITALRVYLPVGQLIAQVQAAQLADA
jgi:hypothetical protein